MASLLLQPLKKSVNVSARSEAFDDVLCKTKNDFADKFISPHTFRLYKSIVVIFISAPSSLRNSPRIIFIPARRRGERIRLILHRAATFACTHTFLSLR